MPDRWTVDQLKDFLNLRQEFFLDPLGSNRERMEVAAGMLQGALFSWYLNPAQFPGMLSLVRERSEAWREMRRREHESLEERRFTLRGAFPEVPSVESGVTEDQAQRIGGSLNMGPGTFERFLAHLDEATNPSLRFNHRYLGELLPHDNMVSYLAAMTATFLNENAIIGKASPCVTHMEQAVVRWLTELVGWDGRIEMQAEATTMPVQRLWTPDAPSNRYRQWERDQPTGTIVSGGTIANITALAVARNAVFNYLLHWDGAVQRLGPAAAWAIIQEVWGYQRMVVLSSRAAHYSVQKAAQLAGVGPQDFKEVTGTLNPWVLDRFALRQELKRHTATTTSGNRSTLVLAVVAIAGTTQEGYVDRLHEIADVLDEEQFRLPPLEEVRAKTTADPRGVRDAIAKVGEAMGWAREEWERLQEHFKCVAQPLPGSASHKDICSVLKRASPVTKGANEVVGASHNRVFLHVDAAHGGAYLTVPHLRREVFHGIELADTVTLDGHKMFYCYYPCGGLVVRTTRWARTLAAGASHYISEEEYHEAYGEDVEFLKRIDNMPKEPLAARPNAPSDGARSEGASDDDRPEIARERRAGVRRQLTAIRQQLGRPTTSRRAELAHEPFHKYLEGSRGSQGIMQLYFNAATLGVGGYRSLLEWTYLLARRSEEAISVGAPSVQPVTAALLGAGKPPVRGAMPSVRAEHRDRAPAGLGVSTAEATDDTLVDGGRRVIPVSGGRLLRMSGGDCNQVLLCYVPLDVATYIATQNEEFWTEEGYVSLARPGKNRLWRTLHYLWRVNEHLWDEHLYANPSFTYYVGHTNCDLRLPGRLNWKQAAGERLTQEEEVIRPKQAEALLEEDLRNRRDAQERKTLLEEGLTERDLREGELPNEEARRSRRRRLARLLGEWNVWARRPAGSEDSITPFFTALADAVPEDGANERREHRPKFFCLKLVVMHPYTDETVLSDLLGRIMGWGERSADAVKLADAACAEWLQAKGAAGEPSRPQPGPAASSSPSRSGDHASGTPGGPHA